MRKEYKAPKVSTETVQVGVFGCYGSNDTGGGNSWLGFLNPFFGFCCGGG